MLYIVSSQKEAKLLDDILKRVLPFVGTPHKILPLSEGLPTLAEGDLLLGMGTTVFDEIKKISEVKPKNLGLASARGRLFSFHAGNAMLTYDPFMTSVDPALMPQAIWDVQLACRYHDTGSLEPKVGKYEWVTSFADVIRTVKEIHAETGKAVPVSPDLETLGLDPWHVQKYEDEGPDARIITIFFTVKEGQSYGLRLPEEGTLTDKQAAEIEWLLTSPMVKSVGANLKYDILWMSVHWGIRCTNQAFDTMLVGSLLDENRSNSLNLHAKVYTTMGGYDDGFNRKYDKGRMDLALADDPEHFKVYAGGDTDACLRTYRKMRPELIKDKRLLTFYARLLQPASLVFSKMEERGVVVDKKRYLELEIEVGSDIEKLTEQALDCLPRRLKNKYADNLSLGRPALLQDFLFTKNGLNLTPQMFTPSGKAPSTAMEHLQMFSDVPEAAQFIGLLKELNGSKKTMSTYITGFMKHLRSDGRFHPTYMLHRGDYDGDDSGAVTGRTSAKDPAFQTIPKHTKWAKPLRSVYVAPPGYAILSCDFSQGELRVTACVADERNMIKTYKQGIDLHLRTGALVNHITLEQALKLWVSKDPEDQKRVKKIRQGGKAGNFGLIYGMSAEGFMNYAWVAYKVKLTLAEAEAFRAAFFKEYPLLLTWHERYKKMAHMNGQVRSPLGRIRHLPLIHSRRHDLRAEAERQSINAPIQSCLSDMMQLAMVELDRMYPDLWMFGMTHDDLSMYVPVEDLHLWAKRCLDVMQNLPLHLFGWEPQLQFIVDASGSYTNLAENEELELIAA